MGDKDETGHANNYNDKSVSQSGANMNEIIEFLKDYQAGTFGETTEEANAKIAKWLQTDVFTSPRYRENPSETAKL